MGALFDADDSVLVVIDVQPGFLHKLPPAEAERVVDCVRWLAEVAHALAVPIVVTEEEPDRHGATEPGIVEALAPDQRRHTKPAFGLAGNPEILADLEGRGRGSVVLCGLETDVCVGQSALGLLELGWKVAVVADAVASPGAAHEQGLARMRDAGVELVGVKGLFYEWIRTVARLELPGLPTVGPAGIVL